MKESIMAILDEDLKNYLLFFGFIYHLGFLIQKSYFMGKLILLFFAKSYFFEQALRSLVKASE